MLFHFLGHSEQGVRTSARLFAKAAMLSGLKASAWVPGRGGGIGNSVSAYARTGKGLLENGMAEPAEADYTMIFEPSLFNPRMLKEGSIAMVNSTEKPVSPQIKKKRLKVLSADAYEHSAAGKRRFCNIVMLGFLAAEFRPVTLGSLKRAVDEEFKDSSKLQEAEAGYRMKPKAR